MTRDLDNFNIYFIEVLPLQLLRDFCSEFDKNF